MSNKTFIGLDIGSNFIKACYAMENSAPKPVSFANQQTQIPTIVISADGRSIHSAGQEALERALDVPLPVFRVEENLKNRSQDGDGIAQAGLGTLAAGFQQQLIKIFDVASLREDEFQTLVANLPGNANQESLLKLVADAGFPDVRQVSAYESVALTFWMEKKLVVYKDTPANILVADFAGQEVRLAALEWMPAEKKFKQVALKVIPWGLDKIDQGLLDGWLLPRFVENTGSLEENQLVGLRHLAGVAKRDLCAKAKQANPANLGVPAAAGNLLKVDRLEISQADFDGVASVRNAFQDLKDLLISACKTDTLLVEVDQVLLVGGGANCYFIEQLAQKIWGEEKVFSVDKPELAVARGLAMLGAGQYIQETNKPKAVLSEAPQPEMHENAAISTQRENSPHYPHPQAGQNKQRRKMAEGAMTTAATIGVIVSLFASLLVIPGIASFFLIAVEYWLVQKIVKIYGKTLTGGMQWFVLVVLLVMSFALKTVVETLLTIGVVTCILKPVVAALVIWGIGELVVYAMSNDILSRYQ